MVSRATLNRHARSDDHSLKHLTSTCKKLAHLEISDSFTSSSLVSAVHLVQNLSTVIIRGHHGITLDAVTRLLRTCGCLVQAEFHSIYSTGATAVWPDELPNLKSLWLGAGDVQTLGITALRLVWSLLFPIVDIC